VEGNQIASFYTGAMANAGELSFRTAGECGLAIISPNDPRAMLQYAEECRTLGIPYIWDPGQQCARMSGDELREGLIGATVVICNDYELELLKQKTGIGEEEILKHSQALVVTRGEHGSSIVQPDARTDVAAVPPHRIVDPTGVGDAFRAGFLSALAWGLSLERAAQTGNLLATHALAVAGPQDYVLRPPAFIERFTDAYGADAAAEVAAQIQ
jgi:adenosine kinase